MTATRHALSVPADVRCHLDFEAVLDSSEGTNIDALISTADGHRTIIEIKFTERTFGAARADARHLAKLENVYKPLLTGRVAESCFQPTTFFRNYQLYRNLAQVRRDSADRVLLLLPRARTELWQHAMTWCRSAALDTLSQCIEVVAIEDLIAALTADAATCKENREVVIEISRKYIPAG
jgi:hypothetical protein